MQLRHEWKSRAKMEIHNVPFFVKQSFSLILASGTVFCFFPFYMGELASCFWSWTYFLNTRRKQAWKSKWVACKTLVVFAFEMLCPKNWKQYGDPWNTCFEDSSGGRAQNWETDELLFRPLQLVFFGNASFLFWETRSSSSMSCYCQVFMHNKQHCFFHVLCNH